MGQHRVVQARQARLKITATVVGLGIVGVGMSSALPANASAKKIRVVQHNTDQQEPRWLNVLAQGGSSDLLLAEEVCEKWVEDARANPAMSAWTFSFHRQKKAVDTPEGAKACPASADGNTFKGPVAVHTGPGNATEDQVSLKGSGDKNQDFGLACVIFTHGGRKVHGCATHLQVYGDKTLKWRTKQTADIKKVTGAWMKKASVVLGGDFNLTPSKSPMTNIYQPNGKGRFVEGEQLESGRSARVGEGTTVGKKGDKRKIDYVFFSTNFTPPTSAGKLKVSLIEKPEDGHAVLTATAKIR